MNQTQILNLQFSRKSCLPDSLMKTFSLADHSNLGRWLTCMICQRWLVQRPSICVCNWWKVRHRQLILTLKLYPAKVCWKCATHWNVQVSLHDLIFFPRKLDGGNLVILTIGMEYYCFGMLGTGNSRLATLTERKSLYPAIQCIAKNKSSYNLVISQPFQPRCIDQCFMSDIFETCWVHFTLAWKLQKWQIVKILALMLHLKEICKYARILKLTRLRAYWRQMGSVIHFVF